MFTFSIQPFVYIFSRGAAGIRGLGAPGTAPPRSLVRQLNQFDRMALHENGRNFALKLRFDPGFDNGGPSPAWIPQVNNFKLYLYRYLFSTRI